MFFGNILPKFSLVADAGPAGGVKQDTWHSTRDDCGCTTEAWAGLGQVVESYTSHTTFPFLGFSKLAAKMIFLSKRHFWGTQGGDGSYICDIPGDPGVGRPRQHDRLPGGFFRDCGRVWFS